MGHEDAYMRPRGFHNASLQPLCSIYLPRVLAAATLRPSLHMQLIKLWRLGLLDDSITQNGAPAFFESFAVQGKKF